MGRSRKCNWKRKQLKANKRDQSKRIKEINEIQSRIIKLDNGGFSYSAQDFLRLGQLMPKMHMVKKRRGGNAIVFESKEDQEIYEQILISKPRRFGFENIPKTMEISFEDQPEKLRGVMPPRLEFRDSEGRFIDPELGTWQEQQEAREYFKSFYPQIDSNLKVPIIYGTGGDIGTKQFKDIFEGNFEPQIFQPAFPTRFLSRIEKINSIKNPMARLSAENVMINKALIISIAIACHQANKAWCEENGDLTQKDWNLAEEWQKESAIKGVEFRLNNPYAGPDAQHKAWSEDKLKDGWVYGEIKDAEKKTHPCLVPFNELPEFQQKKDKLFTAIVDALSAPIRTELTFGQKAVGLTFNPSGNPLVNHLKQRHADLIDIMDDLRINVGGGTARHASVAITELEGAQMRTVKAATWVD